MKQVPRHGLLVGGAVLLIATVWFLRGELASVSGQRLALATRGISATDLALAALLTTASYTVLTGCELLAFAHAGVALSRWRIVLTSFLGYAVSNTVGFSMLSGAAVRYRFYSRWEITARQISGIVAFYAGTFWLGLMVIGGWGLWRTSVPLVSIASGVNWTKALGAVILLMSPLYLLASMVWRHQTIRGRTYDLPGWRIACLQYVLSILDWTLSAGVLWVLLPDPKPAFSQVSVAFVVAQLAGVASHLPGGIGAFEALIVAQLGLPVPMEGLLLAMVAFRGIYYLGPFTAAVGIIAADECRQWWGRCGGSDSRRARYYLTSLPLHSGPRPSIAQKRDTVVLDLASQSGLQRFADQNTGRCDRLGHRVQAHRGRHVRGELEGGLVRTS